MVNEDERLSALHSYGILDMPREAAFDEITEAVANFCDTPIAVFSLVDATRQWFMAEVGAGMRETSRDVSFCTHTMYAEDVYVVHDARLDPLFSQNPLVVDAPNVRFYAGAPIKTPEGLPLGALCVIDTKPRPQGLTQQQTMMLKLLAKQVETQLQLRRRVQDQAAAAQRQAALMAAAVQREERLVAALDSAEVGWWDWEIATDTVVGNQHLARSYGVEPGDAERGMPVAAFFANIHPADLPWVRNAIADTVSTGRLFREEYRLLVPGRDVTWVSARGGCLRDAQGRAWRFPGIAIDITRRKLTEHRLREADVGRELAMEAAQLGRFDHNPSRHERFYDARALEMLGMTEAEVRDLDFVLRHVHPDDRPRLACKLAEVVDPSRSGPFSDTFRLTRPRTGEERWVHAVGKTQFSDGVCTRFMGVFEDVTEAKVNEAHRQLLANELNHRMKNTLAVVLSIVNNSLRGSVPAAEARADINGRIMALSRANDLLTAESWSAASVSEIVQGMIETLALPQDRLELRGEVVRLGPGPALQLAMALHELATNAVKYGALSDEVGRLAMSWGVREVDGAPSFVFDWSEQGGPVVSRPARQGFGSRLIQQATAAAFRGAVAIDYPPAGVIWRLTAPYAGLAELGRSEVDPAPPRPRLAPSMIG